MHQIKAIHADNRLEHNQFTTSKEMLNALKFSVPLDKLYKVVASCNYNQANLYCPVIVEVIDSVAKERYGANKPYLLQLWNKKGEMVFERPLEQPVANWNIANDVFMF